MTISAEGGPGNAILALADGASASVSNSNEGRFRWNTPLNRLEYSENGGPWQPFVTGGGSDSSVLTCSALVNLSDAVAITAAATVDQAENDNAARRPAVGLVVSKPTATSCIVRYSGELPGFVGLTIGATYYLAATLGAITPTPPSRLTDPGAIRQVVGVALSTTILIVDIERDVLQLST